MRRRTIFAIAICIFLFGLIGLVWNRISHETCLGYEEPHDLWEQIESRHHSRVADYRLTTLRQLSLFHEEPKHTPKQSKRFESLVFLADFNSRIGEFLERCGLPQQSEVWYKNTLKLNKEAYGSPRAEDLATLAVLSDRRGQSDTAGALYSKADCAFRNGHHLPGHTLMTSLIDWTPDRSFVPAGEKIEFLNESDESFMNAGKAEGLLRKLSPDVADTTFAWSHLLHTKSGPKTSWELGHTFFWLSNADTISLIRLNLEGQNTTRMRTANLRILKLDKTRYDHEQQIIVDPLGRVMVNPPNAKPLLDAIAFSGLSLHMSLNAQTIYPQKDLALKKQPWAQRFLKIERKSLPDSYDGLENDLVLLNEDDAWEVRKLTIGTPHGETPGIYSSCVAIARAHPPRFEVHDGNRLYDQLLNFTRSDEWEKCQPPWRGP